MQLHGTMGRDASSPKLAASLLDGLVLQLVRLQRPRSLESEMAGAPRDERTAHIDSDSDDGYESWEADYEDEEEDAQEGAGAWSRSRSRSRSRSVYGMHARDPDTAKYTLSVTTFNVLAPCHFRA